MAIAQLTSDEDVTKFSADKGNSVLYLYATWAVHCEQINEVIRTLAAEPENKSISFAMADAEGVQGFCKNNGISSVPSIICFKNGEIVSQLSGADAAKITRMISNLREGKVAASDLNSRLKALINRAPVMLFMKGTPEEARCGFSKKILQILKENDVQFGYFDILSDESVRQGLKVYSDWPTYPQLYAKGELIGGVDIVKQLDESNELKSALGMF